MGTQFATVTDIASNVTTTTATMFNDTGDNSTRTDEWLSTVFFPICSAVICITGMLGNGFVIFMLLYYTGLRTVPNVYIFNLALADLLFLCSLPFLTYFYHINYWIFGKIVCKVVSGIDGMNMFTGIFILTAMSIDRYLAIVHGIRSMKYRTVKAAKITNCMLWLLSTLVTLPVWIYSDEHEPGLCDIRWPEHIDGAWFIIYTFVIGFVLPVVIISSCYIFILFHVIHSGPKSENNRKSSSASRKVFVMVSLAVAAFAMCWLPFYVTRLLYVFHFHSSILRPFFVITLCLSYANSALNPLIYTYTGGNFRKNLAKMRKRSGSRRSSFRTSDMRTTVRRGVTDGSHKERGHKNWRQKRRYRRHRNETLHMDSEITYTSCVVIPNNSREVISELVSVI
ncbi:somatostatin receptor type 2-like [Ptychodera flava]|uniref:somatostatin receptor type 2-like n=1 Tax=Ptychodera flava TaxID=63121 RepID=UPI00396A83A3